MEGNAEERITNTKTFATFLEFVAISTISMKGCPMGVFEIESASGK